MGFGLKDLAATVPDLDNVRRTHWVSLAMVVIFVYLAAIAVGAFYLSPGLLAGGSLVGGMALCCFFVVAGSSFYVRAGPGPDSIRVDQQELTFRYESGRMERVPWSKPGLRIRIEKTSGLVRRGIPRPDMAVVIGGFPSRKYITLEALDEVTRQASAVGLSVSEEASSFPGFSRVMIRHA